MIGKLIFLVGVNCFRIISLVFLIMCPASLLPCSCSCSEATTTTTGSREAQNGFKTDVY